MQLAIATLPTPSPKNLDIFDICHGRINCYLGVNGTTTHCDNITVSSRFVNAQLTSN